MGIKHLIFGRPLKTKDQEKERLNVLAGLSLLAPDALSSVAYGTEEILITLAPLGAVVLWYSLPISAVIVLLLTFLVISYRQVIKAYPSGGGAYVVGRDTLGTYPSLMAGAALLVDYILTVAVSITSGVAAVIAAFPHLAEYRIIACVLIILLMMVVNLRGVRESATLFAPATYLFIILVVILVVGGILKAGIHFPTAHTLATPPVVSGLTLILLLRAFSSGSSALTGIEALSNGVPIFKSPSAQRARVAILLLGLSLGTMFFGTSLVAFAFHIQPSATSTVLQQLASAVFGNGPFFYLLAFTTMAILAIAANASFAGFPQLANIMAKDKWVPRMFLARGDRLVYQNGIWVLGFVAILLVLLFGGNTDRLIPLYAIGVYISFTVAQLGLLKKHLQEKTGNLFSMVVAGVGAVLTAVVVVVAAVSKFTEGAWIVVVLLPLLIVLFKRIRLHYEAIADELRLPSTEIKPESHEVMIVVPFASINRMTVSTMSYALSVSDRVVAVNVAFSEAEEEVVRARWEAWNPDPRIRLVVLVSQYRSVARQLLRYIDHLKIEVGKTRLMVLIPEFVVGRFWQNLLHNQMGILLQASLVFRKDVVVAMVPFHLSGR